MKRTTLIDISEMLWHKYPRIEDVLYFLNQPIPTFFGYLLKGVEGNYLWSADPYRQALHRSQIVDTLLDAWERLNLSDERSGMFSGSTCFSSTYDCVEYFTNLYHARILAVLTPDAKTSWQVLDYRIHENYLYMTVQAVGER